MTQLRLQWLWAGVVAILMAAGAGSEGWAASVPNHVYLTWRQSDTSRTMTVVFHGEPGLKKPTVYYGLEPSSAKLARYKWKKEVTDWKSIPGLPRQIYFVELTGLSPHTTYFFTVAAGNSPLGSEKKFRTLPAGEEEVQFVTGGDLDVTPYVAALHRQAAKTSPYFAALGGDIAYDNGNLDAARKWDEWLALWTKHMVTPQGHLIPIVMAIGNHEVKGGYNGTREKAPFYVNYFPQGEQTYFTRQFGKSGLLYVLDSGHISPHGGAQAQWLRLEMERTAAIPQRFALYHVPIFPSVREDTFPQTLEARKHWLPVFDQYRLTAAFENHDHALKRTKPIRGQAVHADGTVYFGDGCWGRESRPTAQRRWYLEKAGAIRHFWAVKLSRDRMIAQAIDDEGKLRDQHEITAKRSLGSH